MATTLFYDDFDENSVGFGGPPFHSWSVGGEPVAAGHWRLFYPDSGPEPQPNKTLGTGKYAGVHKNDPEFIDTLIWLISPLIPLGKCHDLTLSADVHFQARGFEQGEDRVEIYILPAGSDPQLLGVIGENLSQADPPIIQNMSWELIVKQAEYVQIAFTWKSSMGHEEYDSIQLDNIHLEGS